MKNARQAGRLVFERYRAHSAVAGSALGLSLRLA